MQDSLKNIRKLPSSILQKLDKLIVNRVGKSPTACMLTRDIINFISPKQTYRFEADISLALTYPSSEEIQKIEDAKLPVHAVLTGEWFSQESTINHNANILGGMGMLVLNDNQSVKIPVIRASKEDLAFYNARLLSIGDTLVFETKQDLPLTETSIGNDYVSLYLSQAQEGGGEYIEHHDEPHFWAPKHNLCGGHILLGRQMASNFYLTGFQIPFGKAIYLSPNSLHSDAYLTGDYLVVYTVTSSYSTVIFKDERKELKSLEFVETMEA